MAEDIVEQPTESAPAEEPELETLAVEREGKKMVPLEEAARLRQERREYKEKAERVDGLEREVAEYRQYTEQAKPILETIQARIQKDPNFMKLLTDPDAQLPTAQPKDPQSEEYVELAKLYDLYDASGQPDVARINKINAIQDKRVQNAVQTAVGPIQETTTKDKAAQNYQWAKNFTFKDGSKPDAKYIDAAFNSLAQNPAAAADPQAAQTALLYAIGMERLNTMSNVAAPESEPVGVESAGGSFGRGGPIIGDSQRRVAKDLGVSEKEFEANVASVIEKGGVLE